MIFTVIASAQPVVHSFESADSLSRTDPKPYVIFVRTTWCKICEMMEHSTLKDPRVVEILNNDFYFIDFYADENRTVEFGKKSYYFEPTGNGTGTNELAYELASIDGKLIFPTLVFMDTSHKILLKKHSFTDSATLLELLKKIRRR